MKFKVIVLFFLAQFSMNNIAMDMSKLSVQQQQDYKKLLLAIASGNAKYIEERITTFTDFCHSADPFYFAIQHNFVEITKLLIAANFNVDGLITIDFGTHQDIFTPLHQAISSRNKEVISLLLESGADHTIPLIRVTHHERNPGSVISVYKNLRSAFLDSCADTRFFLEYMQKI